MRAGVEADGNEVEAKGDVDDDANMEDIGADAPALAGLGPGAVAAVHDADEQLEHVRLTVDAAERAVFRLVVNLLEKKVQHNETQESLKANLKIITECLGKFLPPEIVSRLPNTYKKALKLARCVHRSAAPRF